MTLVFALLLACSGGTSEPAAPPATSQQAKAKAIRSKQIRARARARGKARGGRAAARGPAKKIGAAGPVTGELVLRTEGEGNAAKTRAELHMKWEGGQHRALLGNTPGACELGEPREVAKGVVAQWWAHCTYKEMTADFAVLQSGGMLVVQRAITRDGQTGEWVTVHRIPLAEGIELTAGEVTLDPVPGTTAPTREGETGATEPAGEPAAAPPSSPEPAPAPPASAPAPE